MVNLMFYIRTHSIGTCAVSLNIIIIIIIIIVNLSWAVSHSVLTISR